MKNAVFSVVDFYRVIVVFIVSAQYIVLRNHYLNDYLLVDYRPVVGDFFPSLLTNPFLASFFLLIGMILGLYVCFFNASAVLLKIYASYVVLLSLFMNIHQQGFFVQSFVTTFWVGLFLFWLSRNISLGKTDSMDWQGRGMLLSKVIISLVFLGGTIGKLNDYYWSGQAFELLNVHNPIVEFLGYGVFGKLVVTGELLLTLTILIPNRWAFMFSFLLILGMYLSTGYKIFDAIGPVMGLAFANLAYQYKSFFHWLSGRKGQIALFIGIFIFTNVVFKLITLQFFI